MLWQLLMATTATRTIWKRCSPEEVPFAIVTRTEHRSSDEEAEEDNEGVGATSM